jgi:hypothetical protein
MRLPILPLQLSTFSSLAGAVLMLAACTSIRPVTPDDLASPDRPSRVRVTQFDRSVVVLKGPEVIGDTLVGTANGVRRQILLSDVNTMSAKKAAPGKTALLVFGGAGAAFLFWDVAIRFTTVPATASRCCPNCNTTGPNYNGTTTFTC